MYIYTYRYQSMAPSKTSMALRWSQTCTDERMHRRVATPAREYFTCISILYLREYKILFGARGKPSGKLAEQYVISMTLFMYDE